ncbi:MULTISPECIES: TetR/AcrR family transcriptional regulator [unclassified Agarivorans]|uniref:TetR/AcrR family transcriptional regulator n=1 Tax=unclassified Agarivorans TaxID=2636026 RepID=UPI003D7CB2A1
MSLKCCGNPGRPRNFDPAKALAAALQVFWEKGYEGASLNELTQAMGINKPSMYATFGNKEQLFFKAIELYEQRPNAYFYPALAKATAYQVAEHILQGAITNLSDPTQPQGCVVIQAALSCGQSANSIKEALKDRRNQAGAALLQRFQRAQQEQDLRADASPEALAHYLATVLQGLNVHATNGASIQQLELIAKLTLATFQNATRDPATD